MSKEIYICKGADICPATNTPCSPECRRTTNKELALYKEHRCFQVLDNGDKWEIKRA